jgi:hypothetical protein
MTWNSPAEKGLSVKTHTKKSKKITHLRWVEILTFRSDLQACTILPEVELRRMLGWMCPSSSLMDIQDDTPRASDRTRGDCGAEIGAR